MKKILVLSVMILSINANAGLVNYVSASASSKLMKLTDSSVDDLVSEKNPACIKDGNSIKKTNETFRKMGLRYGDCSEGAKALERARMKGYTVNVIKLEQISDAKAKALGLI
jgi:hypothetical protein